mgnify:CR=1 FL=1
MKYLLYLLLLVSCLSVYGQTNNIMLTISLDERCGFDSVLIQSYVSGQVVKLGLEPEQTVSLFAPVDMVLVAAEGDVARATAFNIPVEKTLHITADSAQGCTNLLVESEGQKRKEEFDQYQALSREEKQQQLLPLIRKNRTSITVMDYLQDYRKGDFVQEELSKQIVALFAENPGPVSEHHFIQMELSGIKLTYQGDTMSLDIPDSVLVAYATPADQHDQDAYQYQVIDFWYTTCPPCLKNHQLMLSDMEQGTFPPHVELIGIATYSSEAAWRSFLDEQNLPWVNYFLKRRAQSVLQKHAITAFPTYLLVDNEGVILDRFNSYRKLKEKIDQLGE